MRLAVCLVIAASLLQGALCHAAKKDVPKPVPWSFKPLLSAAIPEVGDVSWPRTRIDRFLLARMEAAGAKPAARAAPRELVRRLFFDVTGMPPPMEAVVQFEMNPTDARYAALVERLLGSPQHGERWGRYWLDLARYTDQTPSWLESTASSFLYRDWVVKALNEDMPYDEFVMRQLAVDQMPGFKVTDLPSLGFLGLSPTYFKELQLPPEIIRTTVADEWEEHVDAVGRTFLGLTLACARCHDHKSDPVSARDYHAVAGVFASVRITERPMMSDEVWKPVAVAREQVGKSEKERDALKRKPKVDQEKIEGLERQIVRLKATPHYNLAMANAVEDAALYVVEADNKKGTKLDYKPGMARDLELMKRGDPNSLGDVVPRGFLSAFGSRKFTHGSGRLELGKAILEDARPLTARVIVNRIWKLHFGRGLVDTPSEFGNLGDAPADQPLLDDLTARFISNGWSLKWLHREILLSAAWRQTSLSAGSEKSDPENKLVSRMPRRRLDLEAWRDAMLTASGTADLKVGGASLPATALHNHRRTLYATSDRHEMDTFLRLHDFPDPGSHSPTRVETTTPLQQLFTLNGPVMLAFADAFARRLCEAGPDLDARVTHGHAILFQRRPTAKEKDLALTFLAGRTHDPAAWSEYAQALLGSNELLFVD